MARVRYLHQQDSMQEHNKTKIKLQTIRKMIDILDNITNISLFVWYFWSNYSSFGYTLTDPAYVL